MRMAEKDEELQHELWIQSARDLLFYVNVFGWTYNPKNTHVSRIPFVTWPYQDDAFRKMEEAIDSGHDAVIEKSRDMGASWMMLTLFQHRWQFRPLQSFLMMSRKEDLVDESGNSDSLFWKLDFLLEHQPNWLRPQFQRNQMSLVNLENKSIISGETTNQNAGRGGRRTAVLIDEAAAIPKLVDVDAATADVTDCRFWNSTPMGRNHFYRLRCNKDARIIRLHWSQHPLKARGLYTSE